MNSELLTVLDYLEKERGLGRDVLTKVIEESLVNAAKKAIGPVNELRVHLDPQTGDIHALAKLEVVEKVIHPQKEISIKEVLPKMPNVKIGDELDWEVTPENFGRIAAQTARQGIMQRLRDAERYQVREDYANRIGELLYGIISRIERGNVIIQFGRIAGALPIGGRVPREDYQIGDHICCVLVEINMDRPGPVLIVSRSTPELVRLLFEREVTETGDGIVDIKSVSRDPGYRSKITVHSNDPAIDPVGACVGIRGSRVKTVVRELNGEKIDIIHWDPDVEKLVANALKPAEIESIKIHEEARVIDIFVDKEQLSLAIGRKGRNARLTSKMVGWEVKIQESTSKKQIEFEEKLGKAIHNLQELLGITKEIAEQLVHHGFLTREGIKAAEEEDLTAIDGIDSNVAKTIKELVDSAE